MISPEAARAREAIRAGINYCRREASSGWELRLLSFSTSGQASFIAHDCYDDGSVLPLAFGDREDLRTGGRVTYASAIAGLRLRHEEAIRLGFHNGDSALPDEKFDLMWQDEFFIYLGHRYGYHGQRSHAA